MTIFHLAMEQLTATLWLRLSSQIFIHQTMQSSNPYLSHFEMECDHFKDLAQVQADDITCTSFLYQCCHSIIGGHHIGQARSALCEAMLAVSDHLLL